jgi:hypothetical protein
MKFIRGTSTAGIFLFFGTMAPVYAQPTMRATNRASPKSRVTSSASAAAHYVSGLSAFRVRRLFVPDGRSVAGILSNKLVRSR